MARTPDETKKPASKARAKAPGTAAAKTGAKAAATAKPRARAAEPAETKPARSRAAAPAKAPRARSAAPASAKPAATRTRALAKPAAAPAKPAPRTTATVRAAPKPAAKASPSKAATPKTAEPKAPRAPKRLKKLPVDQLQRLVAAAKKSLEDDKAEDIVVLDVTQRASYADFLIIATGLADRQIQAMAVHIDKALGEEGLKLRRDSVQSSEDWVLIDAGDLIIHLFKPESRLKFDLEKMWGPDSPLGEAGPGEQSPI